MGVVYLASDPMLSRQVAVKTVDLQVEDADQREFLRNRLLRDARAAALLKHPNIVAIHDIFEEGGRAYVVMEYVEGDTLAAMLKATSIPDPSVTLKVLRQMAEALDYTHSRGVIHRDIKPANVMIDSSGAAKIMDFGIARITDTRTSTPTGMVMGTVEYMAPEQILGEPLDGHADQFSLAVVAYQMLTGSTLFGPHTMATLTYKLVNESAPPPCTRNAALPLGVDTVLAKALAKAPAARFASCSEFVSALARVFSEAPTAPLTQAAPAVASPPTVAAPARSSRSAALVAAALVVLAAGGALAVWKPWNRAPQDAAAVTAPPIATAPPVPNREPAAANTGAPPKPEPAHEVSTSPSVSKSPEPTSPPADTKSTPPVSPVPVEPPEMADEAEDVPPPPPRASGAQETPFEIANQHGLDRLRNKDYPAAIVAFSKAIELHPNFAAAYHNRGAAQQNLEHYELAIQNYSDAIRLAPTMASSYASRGVCLVHLHRDPEALIDFQHALELKPDLASALRGRAGVYLRRKQYRMALADYDAALKKNPRFAPAYLNRARVKEALGDLRGAAADRQREAELRAH
jgi:serine/threonine protein kinase